MGDRLWLSPSEECTLLLLSSLEGDRGTTCRASSCCRRTRALALVCASAALGVRSDQGTESGDTATAGRRCCHDWASRLGCQKGPGKGSCCRVLSLGERTRKENSRLGVENNSRLGVALCSGNKGNRRNYDYSLSYKRELRSQRACVYNE